jgi:uncharacterized protein (DUF1330 family)
MVAYVIGEAEVLKPENLTGYGPAVAASIAAHGGKYLVRGAKPHVLEGGPAHSTLIIEFPSVEQAKAWYASDEYAKAKAIRHGNTNLRLVVVDSFIKPP